MFACCLYWWLKLEVEVTFCEQKVTLLIEPAGLGDGAHDVAAEVPLGEVEDCPADLSDIPEAGGGSLIECPCHLVVKVGSTIVGNHRHVVAHKRAVLVYLHRVHARLCLARVTLCGMPQRKEVKCLAGCNRRIAAGRGSRKCRRTIQTIDRQVLRRCAEIRHDAILFADRVFESPLLCRRISLFNVC